MRTLRGKPTSPWEIVCYMQSSPHPSQNTPDTPKPPLERSPNIEEGNRIIYENHRNDMEESSRIISNQKIFPKSLKNKEYFLKAERFWNRLKDIFKSSENIAGEAIYQVYMKRLKDFA
ncbi:hypothetical protein AT1G43415 [Arabidopsis thaliana]|uniref:Uncharacterized protein n=2 Tax=Arabidopsis thaliana TaxID=3702 RepID=F4IB55_ARATH|nr:uncharacterized protein AT1G43415 [Arabidopsis thaliana]AEE31969.1 hypothetical protein AT1G43415 [Arabidopsis thaliana]|eukprot:NP_683373.1 hypothetical protein AT1G43415 [Arabidopsis thaliana]